MLKKSDMKKLFLLLAISMIFVANATSQSFYGGVALGGVTSQVKGDMRVGWDKFGITAGGFVGLHLNNTFNAQMELKYIQKGSKSDIDNPVAGDPYKIQLGYVELPLLVSANLSVIRVNGRPMDWLTFELGASLDVLLHQQVYYLGAAENGPNYFKRVGCSTLVGVKFSFLKRCHIALRSVNSIISIYMGNLSKETCRRFGSKGVFADNIELVFFYQLK